MYFNNEVAATLFGETAVSFFNIANSTIFKIFLYYYLHYYYNHYHFYYQRWALRLVGPRPATPWVRQGASLIRELAATRFNTTTFISKTSSQITISTIITATQTKVLSIHPNTLSLINQII